MLLFPALRSPVSDGGGRVRVVGKGWGGAQQTLAQFPAPMLVSFVTLAMPLYPSEPVSFSSERL